MSYGKIKQFNVNPEEWTNYGEWQQPPLQGNMWVNWYDKKICKEMDIPELDGRFIMIYGNHILPTHDLQRLEKRLERAIEDLDKEFFLNLRNVSEKVFKEHNNLIDRFHVAGESDSELFRDFYTSAWKVTTPWLLSVIFSDHLGEIIAEKCKQVGIDPQTVLQSFPAVETRMVEQHRDALKIRDQLKQRGLLESTKTPEGRMRIQENSELRLRIEAHVNEYEWHGTHHLWGAPLTTDKLLKDMFTLQEEKTTLVSRDELPENLQFLSAIAEIIAFWRTYTPEVFNIVAYSARPLLTRIANQWDMTYSDVLYLTAREIDTLLKNEESPDMQELKRRHNDFVILNNNDTEIVLSDPDMVKEFRNALVGKYTGNADNVTGMIANTGKATGVAKIILVPTDMEKFTPGNVLVTTMTTPDFVPLMSKAAAIVTDIGGLLSHAAVMSRELGKPCVIGTKVATKTFKDGDLIEVDADSGTVRKL